MTAYGAACFLLPLALSASLTPFVARMAGTLGAVDHPSPTRSHLSPTPTLGGLAVLCAVLATLALFGTHQSLPGLASTLALAALPLAAVSALDDVRTAPIAMRLCTHLVAGGALFWGGLRVSRLTNPWGAPFELGPWSFIVTLAWVVVIVNAMNLVDGIDGLAAGIGSIAAVTFAVVGALQGEPDLERIGLVLSGACLGFLPYNFPRARVFLGDVGSTFIGLVLAAASLLQNRKTTASITLLLPLVALGLPLLDMTLAIVRRTARGRNPFRRDLDHLHHRLVRAGLSSAQAAGTLMGVTAALGVIAVALANAPRGIAVVAAVLLGVAGLTALAILARLERRPARRD